MELFLRVLVIVMVSYGYVTGFLRRFTSLLDWNATGLGPEEAEAPQEFEPPIEELRVEINDLSEK
jgi:hypothetical protein